MKKTVIVLTLVLLTLFSIAVGIQLAGHEDTGGKLYTLPVTVGEKTYMIIVRSNCSSAPEASYFGLLKSVSIDFRGSRETIFFNATIPADLIWGELSVYKQGYKQSADRYTMSSNGTHHSVQMTFDHTATVEEISIEGTEGITGMSKSSTTG